VIDFLIGTIAANGAFIRKTMGKGNSIDKSHGKKTRLSQGSRLKAKRQPRPCPTSFFLPRRRGRECWPCPMEVSFGAAG
jgi:hypothetical protein